jgi:hypothetical protein
MNELNSFFKVAGKIPPFEVVDISAAILVLYTWLTNHTFIFSNGSG